MGGIKACWNQSEQDFRELKWVWSCGWKKAWGIYLPEDLWWGLSVGTMMSQTWVWMSPQANVLERGRFSFLGSPPSSLPHIFTVWSQILSAANAMLRIKFGPLCQEHEMLPYTPSGCWATLVQYWLHLTLPAWFLQVSWCPPYAAKVPTTHQVTSPIQQRNNGELTLHSQLFLWSATLTHPTPDVRCGKGCCGFSKMALWAKWGERDFRI